MLTLTAPPARLLIDPAHGGRIASFELNGHQLLITAEAAARHDGVRTPDPLSWGCYAMVPWAGRVPRGRFGFVNGTYQLPINAAPHALHGTGFNRAWDVSADGSLITDLGPSWPFGGHAIQRFALERRSLTCTVEVHNDVRSMPAQAGWHPWFRRPVALTFAARSMYLRDHEGIATGELIPPPAGPWDDCFTDVVAQPKLSWSRGPSIEVTANVDHWVIFDEAVHALCAEPQSGPPNGFNLEPKLVEPGSPLVTTMTWSW